jgi:hypothetical protein
MWISEEKRGYPARRLEESKVTKKSPAEGDDWYREAIHTTSLGKGAGGATSNPMSGIVLQRAGHALSRRRRPVQDWR